MTDITVNNLMSCGVDEVRKNLFGMIPTHESINAMSKDEFVSLLGLYPAIYQYVSEMYVYTVGLVRKYDRAKEFQNKSEAMSMRDMLEQILKSVKFEYDGLSRKVSVLSVEEL